MHFLVVHGSGQAMAYFIFVTGTTGSARGEKICFVEKFLHKTGCHVEKFSTWHIVMWKKLSTWEIWRKSVIWRNYVYNLWCFVALNCCKISFLAIYAVLSRIFCRDSRAFVWRKIVSKIVCVEKKRQISGMRAWSDSIFRRKIWYWLHYFPQFYYLGNAVKIKIFS